MEALIDLENREPCGKMVIETVTDVEQSRKKMHIYIGMVHLVFFFHI